MFSKSLQTVWSDSPCTHWKLFSHHRLDPCLWKTEQWSDFQSESERKTSFNSWCTHNNNNSIVHRFLLTMSNCWRSRSASSFLLMVAFSPSFSACSSKTSFTYFIALKSDCSFFSMMPETRTQVKKRASRSERNAAPEVKVKEKWSHLPEMDENLWKISSICSICDYGAM